MWEHYGVWGQQNWTWRFVIVPFALLKLAHAMLMQCYALQMLLLQVHFSGGNDMFLCWSEVPKP